MVMLYFFDGTKNGFLTAFVKCFHDENAVITSKDAQIPLGEIPHTITTCPTLAKKAEERLLSFDKHALYDLDTLLRSGMQNNEQIAYRYFKLLATKKRPVGKMLAQPDVFAAVECMKKVGHEIHKLHGFVRFMETANGTLYAPISPDNDICDLLLPHFKARFPNIPFVLHDINRKKAAFYDGKNTFVAYLPYADVLLSAKEAEMQSLWKNYFRSVTLKGRHREEQMHGYMPVRYWKHLTELQSPPSED